MKDILKNITLIPSQIVSFLNASYVKLVINPLNKNIYVVDSTSYKINIYDSNGIYVKTFGDFGVQDGEFTKIKSICIGYNSCLYVADNDKKRIQAFNKDGYFISSMKLK